MNARPTYTPSDLEPRQTAAFSRGAMLRQRRWGADVLPPSSFDAPALVSKTAVAAIRRSFLQAKTSHEAWRSFRRAGRLDARQGPRADRGAQDIFRTRTGKSTTRVKVAVLIDASGSMSSSDAYVEHPTAPGSTYRVPRREAAAVFGATIAKALGTIPTVDLDVFQHAAGGGHMTLKYRWAKGTPVAVFNAAAHGYIGGGGNADGHALYAITERMIKSLKRGERGVIMVVSDGLPSVYGSGGRSEAGQALIDAVAHARKNNIVVVGVAIDGSDQTVYYGEGTVKHTGSWTALGSALAKQIGGALATR
jgi:hypothetical protein